MKLSENFTYEELTGSTKARELHIDNEPNRQQTENLALLARTVLQPIRDAWGSPIVVTSGFRSRKLNTAVKGASNSDHLYGCAADIHPTNGKTKELFELILTMAKKGKLKCRQIIDEYNYSWVHVSINNAYNSQKNNQVVHVK